MRFYDLSKEERANHAARISKDILSDIRKNTRTKIAGYFSDEDTYIRKSAYLSVGKIYDEKKRPAKKNNPAFGLTAGGKRF